MSLISKFAAGGFLLVALAALAQTPKPVDAVVADYAKALGGFPAIDAINSRIITASGGLLGKTELYWQKPNKVLLLAGKERTGYDGSTGWHYSKRKRLTRLSQGQQMPLEIDGNPLRYAHLQQLYSDLQPAPQKTVDGTLMDVLIAPNNLAQTVFYFDAHTHLLARFDEKGETSAYFINTLWFEDYQSVDGIQFPFHITHKTSEKGATSEDFKVKTVEQNVSLNAEIFSKPQATKLVLGGKR